MLYSIYDFNMRCMPQHDKTKGQVYQLLMPSSQSCYSQCVTGEITIYVIYISAIASCNTIQFNN